MSVSGISSQSAASEVSAVMRNLRSSLESVDTTDSSSSTSSTDSKKISGPAEFLNKLQQLKESDPEKFTELLQGVADKLKSAAETATDESAKTMLSSLADKFSSVANGGDLSQLEPPKPSSLSGNGQKPYGIGDQADQTMIGQVMGQQGPPPGPPPSDAQGSDPNSTQSTSGSGSSDVRSTLKSIFDELNNALTQALSK